MKHSLVFASLAALTAIPLCLANAQGPTWASPNSLPTARYDHAVAFDEGRGRLVMFGGRDVASNLLPNETWEWDGAAWTLRAPSQSPPARFGTAMAYDPLRGVTVLFGGRTATGDVQDTWEWDGRDWTQLSPTASPVQRWGHAMCYHGGPNPGVLLHGGVLQRDTWLWNGTNWTVLVPTIGPDVSLSGMAYASSQQGTYLLGDPWYGSSTYFWNGGAWIIASATGPSGGTLAYDRVGDRLLVTGGWFNGTYNVGLLVGQFQPGGAVTWSPSGQLWPGGSTQRFVSAASAYDTARRSMLVFGGFVDPVLVGQSATNKLGEMPSSTNVLALRSPSIGVSPSFRTYTEMAFDVPSGKAVLFGGWDGFQVLNDAWTFDGRTWTNLGPAGVAARMQPALCYLPSFGATVLFGGGDMSATFYNDTMVWSGSGFLPTIGTGVSPPARRDHDMVCDTARNRIVMYGGYDGSFLSDTWELRSVPFGLQWNQIATVGSPGPRNGHRMAYDQRRQKVVMFGGSNQGTFDGTTWEYTPGNFTIQATWTQMAPAQSPPARWLPTMEYDPARGVIVLSGGYGDPTCGNFCASYLNDAWEYDGITWTQRFPENPPIGREGAASCYDTLRQRVIVQGGNASFTLDDTWFYNAPVDRFAPGMVGGSTLELRCLKFPVAGLPVRLSFGNPSGLGWITIYPGPAPGPGLPLGPPLLCGAGTVYGFPPILVDAMGNPGAIEFPLPASMAGQGFVAQGVSFDFAACINLTDPLAVTVHAP